MAGEEKAGAKAPTPPDRAVIEDAVVVVEAWWRRMASLRQATHDPHIAQMVIRREDVDEVIRRIRALASDEYTAHETAKVPRDVPAEGIVLLVCGGRDYAFRGTLFEVLDGIHAKRPVRLLVHGDARGADALAKEWASKRGLLQRWWPADWKAHGKGAGPKRNQRMLDEAHPGLVVAFPGGRGTADMVRRAVAAGVQVLRINHAPAPLPTHSP